MGLTKDQIIAVTLVGVFYTILLGRYSMRLFKKWCNRKKKATDIGAQNETETTETKEPSSPLDQSSSSSLTETTNIEAQNETATGTAKESSSLSDQSSSSELGQTAKPNGSSSLSDPQSSSSVLVQKPKPCVTTA